MSTTVTIYEDTAGHIHITDGAELWDLGAVTPDMRGAAARDAQRWLAGVWRPTEEDGQTREAMAAIYTNRDTTELIAAWRGGEIYLNTGTNGEYTAGPAGREYLGLREEGP